jgi:hypothetical protein
MRTVLLMIALLLGANLITHAQQNVVKYNAGALTEKTFSIGFERALSDRNSLQLTVDYHTEKDKDVRDGDRYNGIGLSGEYRFYGVFPKQDKPVLNGLFAGPSVAYRSIAYKSLDRSDPFDERFNVVQAGVVAGYQWLSKSGFTAEASIAGMAGVSFSEDGTYFGDYFGIGPRFDSGIVPVFSLSVGYAFGKKK